MTSSFHPTRWTLVLQARGEGEPARAALSDLCGAYYLPVVGFLRREGRSEDAARELAHAFFETLLTDGVGTPDPQRGRFRSYLLGALKHFLSNRRAAELAAKRGAGIEHVSLEEEMADDFAAEDQDSLSFDREWALALIARALAALELEHAAKPASFSVLKPWLDGHATRPQIDAAEQLGLSGNAVKVAIFRLRSRFRQLVRDEISATVDDPAEAREELRHLIAILSLQGDQLAD